MELSLTVQLLPLRRGSRRHPPRTVPNCNYNPLLVHRMESMEPSTSTSLLQRRAIRRECNPFFCHQFLLHRHYPRLKRQLPPCRLHAHSKYRRSLGHASLRAPHHQCQVLTLTMLMLKWEDRWIWMCPSIHWIRARRMRTRANAKRRHLIHLMTDRRSPVPSVAINQGRQSQ